MNNLSRTMQALAMVEAGLSSYKAAKAVGVQVSAVTRAIARRKGKEICPCCGQIVRDGFVIQK